jgi:hypothetical protein
MHPLRAIHASARPTTVGHARRSAVRATALSAGLALTLLAGADAARANTLIAPTASANPRATVAMTVSVSGSADPSGTLRVYAQQGASASGCAGGASGAENAQAQRDRPGSTEVIAREPVGPFSYSASYTPPAAGTYYLCAYLFGSSPSTGASQSSSSFNVGAAPPPPPPAPGAANPPASPGSPGVTGTVPALKRCVVPTLKGRSYFGARLLIRRAGCSVGSVFRPDLRTSRAARARGRVLRVVLQSPKPHSVRKLGARVTLRLAYVTPKKAR